MEEITEQSEQPIEEPIEPTEVPIKKPMPAGRDERGRFLPGISGNPAGKTPGSISIITAVKRKFMENPEMFEEWVDGYMKDPAFKKHIAEMVDGKPKQQLEHSGDIGLPFIINVERYDGDGDERGDQI